VIIPQPSANADVPETNAPNAGTTIDKNTPIDSDTSTHDLPNHVSAGNANPLDSGTQPAATSPAAANPNATGSASPQAGSDQPPPATVPGNLFDIIREMANTTSSKRPKPVFFPIAETPSRPGTDIVALGEVLNHENLRPVTDFTGEGHHAKYDAAQKLLTYSNNFLAIIMNRRKGFPTVSKAGILDLDGKCSLVVWFEDQSCLPRWKMTVEGLGLIINGLEIVNSENQMRYLARQRANTEKSEAWEAFRKGSYSQKERRSNEVVTVLGVPDLLANDVIALSLAVSFFPTVMEIEKLNNIVRCEEKTANSSRRTFYLNWYPSEVDKAECVIAPTIRVPVGDQVIRLRVSSKSNPLCHNCGSGAHVIKMCPYKSCKHCKKPVTDHAPSCVFARLGPTPVPADDDAAGGADVSKINCR